MFLEREKRIDEKKKIIESDEIFNYKLKKMDEEMNKKGYTRILNLNTVEKAIIDDELSKVNKSSVRTPNGNYLFNQIKKIEKLKNFDCIFLTDNGNISKIIVGYLSQTNKVIFKTIIQYSQSNNNFERWYN